MKSLIAFVAVASILSTSDAKAWMHHGYGYGGGWGHHDYGWGHHYGWHRWGAWGGSCRLQCNPWKCWRACW